MSNAIAVKNEYRNLPLDQLIECPLNPRYTLDETALHELADSIRSQGVLMPLLVRPSARRPLKWSPGSGASGPRSWRARKPCPWTSAN